MDKILREERMYIAKMVKHIQKTGCNVLLIQKSILRDALTDLSLDFLGKAKILVVRDIEREEVEFLSKMIGCEPVATLEQFTEDSLGTADLVAEEQLSGMGPIIRCTGLKTQSKCVSVLVRATNILTLE